MPFSLRAVSRAHKWIGGIVVGALLAATLATVPTEPAVALPTAEPATVALSANRTSLLAGQTATLTATTDVEVQASASTITIVDQSTGATLKSCTTGTSCVAVVSLLTGGPHTYAAFVDALVSETVVVERAAWAVSLAADASTVVAGATTRLVATANQNLTNTAGSYQTYIFDATHDTLLGSCAVGKTCAIRTPAFTGGGEHYYVAVVAATGTPAMLDEAVDVQAQSEDVSVNAADWTVALVSTKTEVAAGATTKLTATTNQNIGNTAAGYKTYIFDTTAGTLVGSCATGKVCAVTTPAFIGAAHDYVAAVAAAGVPVSLTEAVDVRAQSEVVPVGAVGWSVTLEVDHYQFLAGSSSKLIARSNQNVGKTGGAYVIHIFDRTSGQLVKTCATGRVCSVSQSFTTGPEHTYIAAVAAPGSPATVEEAVDVRDRSNQEWIARAPWNLTASMSTTGLPANGIARLTAVADQSLTKTNGAYAIYWFNAISGERVGSCATGKTCNSTVLDTGSTAPHIYVAYVAASTNPTTVDELVDVMGTSNVVVGDDSWAVTLTSDYAESADGSVNYLNAVPNIDLNGVTNGTSDVGILFFDTTTDTLVGQCANADQFSGCFIPLEFAGLGEHTYRAVIANLTDPATIDESVHIRAVSNDVTVTGREWELSLSFNVPTVTSMTPVTATVTVSPSVPTDPLRYVYLVDESTGQRVVLCAPGYGTCSATRTISPSSWFSSQWFDGFGEHNFVAVLGDAVQATEPISNVMATSNTVALNRFEYVLTLVPSQSVFAVEDKVNFTVIVNQPVDGYAIAVIDATTGAPQGSCYYNIGLFCVIEDAELYGGGPPHEYVAVLKTPNSSMSEGAVAVSNSVTMTRMQWTVSLSATISPYYIGDELVWHYLILDKTANQALRKYVSPGSYWATREFYQANVYNYSNGRYVTNCSYGQGCADYVMYGQPAPCLVVRIERGGEDIQAASGCAPIAEPEAAPGESVGGGNPSESKSHCECADPINTATGEFYLPETDIGIEGAGPSLDVSRTYSSTLASTDGPFGYGWSAAFAAKLEVTLPGYEASPTPKQVQITQENGSTVTFTENPDLTYYAPDRVQATLSRDAATGQFTFTRQSTEIMVFAADGRLLETRDLHGNAVTVGYNGSNQVTTLSASGGRVLTLTWANGHVSQVADSTGRTVGYGYSAAGTLTSVTAIDGAVTSYGYDSSRYMTTVTKPGGAVTTNVYDSSHRVTSQTDPVGRVTTISYSTSGTTVTAPGGSKTVDRYVNGRIASHTIAATTAIAAKTSYTYDTAGNVLTMTNPLGAVTTFTYDADGNMLSATDPLGRSSYWTYDSQRHPLTSTDALGRTSIFTYSAVGDVLTVTGADGKVQHVNYNADGTVTTSADAAGKVTSFVFDSAGRLLRTTDPDGYVSRIAYGASGDLEAVTAPDGEITSVTTDAAGRLLTATDPNGHVTSATYDVRGNRTSTTDANGSVTSTSYDAADRPTSSTDAAGKVTHYTYTPAGQLKTVKDANDHVTTYEYDAAGQLVSVTDPLGRITVYEYDLAGRTVSTVLPSGDDTRATYDAAGQLIAVTDAMDETTHFAYNAVGQLISTTDPLGRVVTSEYTDGGQPSTVTLPDGSTQVSAYTATGQLASFINADGKATSYSYSNAGRLLGKVEPGGLATSVSYDDAGRTDTVTLPDGSTQEYSYDDAGQVTRVHYSAAGSTDTTYVYDDGGRLTNMTDATGTTSFAYDAAGRIQSETDGDGATVAYGYDDVGQLTSITYPGSRTATYAYDAAGQMTSLTDWASHTTSFSWTANGQLATQTDPNGVVQTNSYDDAGRTTLISDASAAGVLASFGYGYDEAGQLVSDSSTNGGATTAKAYAYDPLSQLGAVTTTPAGEPATTGSFDATSAGQLTATAAGDTLVYNAAQQLTSLVPALGAATSYAYDGNGSRTSSTVEASGSDPALATSYAYTATGALASVVTPDGTVDYTVDGRGLRQSRTAGGDTDDFVWSTIGGLPLLLDDGDHAYLYGPSLTPVAQVDDTGAVEYLHGDLLGSVRTITDASGAVAGSSTFDSFGTRTAHTGDVDSAFGFTGAWTDADTGLVHLRARDYDPVTGQFLSVDPAVDSTRQPYAYTGNNPIQRTDPSGLDFMEDLVENVASWAPSVLCASEQVAAFGAGALDSLTFGVSSMVLGAAVPGYDEFVAGHEAAFTAGSIVATVVQAAVMIVATAGAGAGLAVGLVAIKVAAKAAIKAGVKAAERAVVKTAERAGIRSTERAGVQSAERSGVRAAESCAVNSFTAGTPVLMADGTQKPIQDVEVGDEVVASDPESGVTAARPVVSLIRHGGEHTIVKLTFDDGSVITATDEHPFWDVTTGSFVYAGDLKVGDEVLTAGGDTVATTGSTTYKRSLIAYNLEIAGIHTYYAGTTGILVHNSCGIPANGSSMTVNEALDAAEQWLGAGYREAVPGGGRYVSADGSRVVRMGESDITGAHGGGPHMNFAELVPNPARPGRLVEWPNNHVYLTDW